jgi:hypothetical protein
MTSLFFSTLSKMKSIVFLISTAITCTFATKLVTIPFTAVGRNGIRASAYGNRKLGDLIDVPLENIDLAYLIDIEIGIVSIYALRYSKTINLDRYVKDHLHNRLHYY